MTTQVLDTVRYCGDVHELVASEGTGLFTPAEHGLSVVMASTACWRGYRCSYAVAGAQLQLETLEAKAGRYEGEDFRSVELPAINGRAGAVAAGQPFNAVYERLGLPVRFTGELLLGARPVAAVVARLGLAPAWIYERAWLLRFSDGAMADEADLSEAMAAMRAQYLATGAMAAVPALQRPELRWVVSSFLQQL